MKTLLAVAIGAILVSACGSSGNDDPVMSDTPDAAASGDLDAVTTGDSDTGATGDSDTVTTGDSDVATSDDGASSPASGDPDVLADATPASGDGTSASGDGAAPTGSVSPGTDPAAPADTGVEATITADNYTDVLADVFDTFTGNNYASSIFPLPGITPDLPNEDYFALVSEQGSLPIACTNGGTAVYTPRSFGESTGIVDDWTLDGCQAGARVVDGVVTTTQGAGSGALYMFESTGITAESQDESVSFEGSMSYLPTGFRGSMALEWNATVAILALVSGDDTLQLSDLETRYSYGFIGNGDVGANLDGGFTMTSSATGLRPVTVEVTKALSRGTVTPPEAELNTLGLDDFTFQEGTLLVTAEDGNMLELDVDNGDPATARVTITTNGQEEEIVADWSVFAPNLRFARDGRLITEAGNF